MRSKHNLPFTNEINKLFIDQGVLRTYQKGECIPYSESAIENIIVIDGLVKTFVEYGGKKILLYHSEKHDIRVTNMHNILGRYTIRLSGLALKTTTILSISNKIITKGAVKYPRLKEIVINSHQRLYNSLLDAIKHYLEMSFEDRLYSYLKFRLTKNDDKELKIPHSEIATDLNSTRESVSRSIKKLEEKNKIIRRPRSLIIL